MMPKRPTVFWGNERVSHQAIIAQQRQATLERIQNEGLVLLVQDTTSFDFSHHPATSGMGALENEYCRGFLAHSTLAVSGKGVPLGLVGQQVWVRREEERGKRHQRHSNPFAAKESYKWVEGLAEQVAVDKPHWVTVCDREAYIYEFLDVVVKQGGDFIVRASQGRSLTEEGDDLFAHVSQQAAQDHYRLSLKRRPDREARLAQVELRFGSVTVKRPKRAETERATLTLQVVDVFEPDPPLGEEALHWLILTSLPVQTVDQAQQIVTFYTYRWLIERFHYVLKSGCKLEERQLREEKRLERLLAVYSLVAWKLLWLTYQARQTPDAPCTVLLQPAEWQALYAFIHRTQRFPTTPPSLHQAVGWIAQLGGFLGRKGDAEPGVKVLWRGWSRFQDILDTWVISHPSPSKIVGNA
jgi:transposase Tn5 family protein